MRKSRTTSDRLAAAASVQAILLSLVRVRQPSTIAGYVPIGSEPGGADLPDVLARALPPGGRLLLPVLLDDGDLDWAVHSGPFVRGPRGLLEPAGARLGVAAIREASLVVVPAIAVSGTGVRLGRGGGSYDRALSRLATPNGSNGSNGSVTGALVVALLEDGELVDALPAEPHDRAVGAAITPSGGLTLSRSSEWTN